MVINAFNYLKKEPSMPSIIWTRKHMIWLATHCASFISTPWKRAAQAYKYMKWHYDWCHNISYTEIYRNIPQIIHFSRMFHEISQPANYWGTSIYGSLYMSTIDCFTEQKTHVAAEEPPVRTADCLKILGFSVSLASLFFSPGGAARPIQCMPISRAEIAIYGRNGQSHWKVSKHQGQNDRNHPFSLWLMSGFQVVSENGWCSQAWSSETKVLLLERRSALRQVILHRQMWFCLYKFCLVGAGWTFRPRRCLVV